MKKIGAARRKVNHYCTYFDSGYLPQGLALRASLARHDPGSVLWILALDPVAGEVLRRAGGPGIRLVLLDDLLRGDPALAAARGNRPWREFVFTLTPCLVQWLLRTRPEIGALTYVDADLFFFSDPAPIQRELGPGSVLIVPHRFPPWHNDADRCGRFNVGVAVFRQDANSAACLHWWRERCLESCALDGDGARFGDQKYLDEWPARFKGVVECANPGVNAAPWNWDGLPWEIGRDGILVNGERLIVFHFAQFRRISGRWFDSGQLEYGIMPRPLRSRLYGEYWRALEEAEHAIQEIRPGYRIPRRGWGSALSSLPAAVLGFGCGQFWCHCGEQWLSGRFGLGRFSGRILGAYRRRQRRPA